MRPSVSVFALTALLLVLVLPSFARSSGKALVEYNPNKGTITVEAAGVAIEEVLLGISQQTGIRVFIDPEVHKNVTVNLKAVPLESALHQIARGLSYALFFENGRGRQRLAGIQIVPQGKPGLEPPRRIAPAPLNNVGGSAADKDLEYTDDWNSVPRTKLPSRRRPAEEPSRDSLHDTLDSLPETGSGVIGAGSAGKGPILTGPMGHRRRVPVKAGSDDTNDIMADEPESDLPGATTDATGEVSESGGFNGVEPSSSSPMGVE